LNGTNAHDWSLVELDEPELLDDEVDSPVGILSVAFSFQPMGNGFSCTMGLAMASERVPIGIVVFSWWFSSSCWFFANANSND